MNKHGKRIKVMTVFGTRPEAVKMAPLVLELQKHAEQIETIVTVTAQHREMLDQVLNVFKITPHYDLSIMQPNQTLSQITTKALLGLEDVIQETHPDLILVHGDTTTTFAASLAAYYHQIAVGHVEAGLRTHNKYSPFPEELNRVLTGAIADLHFAPTEETAANLIKENKEPSRVFVTGNTAIDALKYTVDPNYHNPILGKINDNQRLILLTAHRRENLGEPMRHMFRAVRRIAETYEDVVIVYPVHLNPKVREVAAAELSNHDRIHLVPPFELLDFHNTLARASIVLTDSGGIQEEAPYFNVPVVVLRDTTERPEGLAAGTSILAGTKEEDVYNLTEKLLTDPDFYKKMAEAQNPYGDGQASKRIVDRILNDFRLK